MHNLTSSESNIQTVNMPQQTNVCCNVLFFSFVMSRCLIFCKYESIDKKNIVSQLADLNVFSISVHSAVGVVVVVVVKENKHKGKEGG